VPARPLTSILSNEEFMRARLFKIDVEGAEWLVVQGFVKCLSRTRPDAEFLIEISPSRLALMQRKPEDILEIFREFGFVAYRIANSYRYSAYVDQTPYEAPRRIEEPILGDADIIFSRVDLN
jgi:hypothetical protein